MGFELFNQEGGFGGPAAALVRADRRRAGVPDPLQRLKEPARVDRQQLARVGLVVGWEAIRPCPVLAHPAARAHAPLEVVDLLGLDYARCLEQCADNEPTLVRSVDVPRVGLHPAARPVIVLVAVLPAHWLSGVERFQQGVSPSAHLIDGNGTAGGVDTSHGRDDRGDGRRCLGGLDNGGRGNGQWCGHANRSSWAGSAGARGCAGSGAAGAEARMRARCAALKANQKPRPCRGARHSVSSTRAVCLACAAVSSWSAATLDADDLPHSAVQCTTSSTAPGP